MPWVHWTTDLIEAEIVCSLLREQGVDATIPHANFVRQDWLAIFATGGYRITVNAADTQAAIGVLQRWRNGEFAIVEPTTPIQCPNCQSLKVEEDTLPRRWRLVVLLFFDLPLFRPPLHCYRCGNCGNRWHEPNANSYGELAAQAEAAGNQ